MSRAGAGALALALCWPVAAQAQDAAPATTAPDAETIIVSGTRITRNGYDAPTPTTVVGSELIEAKAPATIVDALASLPAFKNTSTTSTASNGNSGTAGQSFANLRGIGANRTLVLLDGQRFVPSTSIATVDISLLPTVLLQRVDVVTGGASAAWGSDAVAGVVNFVLDNKFRGIKGSIEAGITAEGDNRTVKAGLAWGASFADRGHIVLSAEYLKANGVPSHSRDDTRYPVAGLITNPAWTATNGQTRRFILPYVYFNNAAFGGVITSGPLKGTEFGPGGSTFQAPTGTLAGSSIAYSGPVNEPWISTNILPALPQERGTAYGRVSWDVTDGLELYASGLYARNKPGPYHSTPANTVVTGVFTIKRDNPFVPDSVRTQMIDQSLNTITVGRYSEDWGDSIVSRTNDTWRGVIGLQGEIGGGWKVNAYGEYGTNRNEFVIDNNVIVSNLAAAVDAVRSGSNIVCASTLVTPGDGCVPINVFGPGAASAAAIDYVYGTSRAILNLHQKVAAASISGEPFSTWAGPVSFAAGAEYREESARQTSDALSQAGRFAIGNPKALSGSFSAKEAFAETVVPLAKDMPFLRQLDLNAAIRVTDYSNSGAVTTWKIGANWEPVEGLRFRGTRSRDIRAPNILELFSSPIQQTAFLVDPVTNTQPSVQTFSLGNPKLRPERADTTAAGVVFQPTFLRGFQLSVDYYRIKIADAISTLALQDIINRCVSGTQELCTLITRTNGAITQMNNPFLNLQSIKTDGLDIEASYRVPVGPGNLTFRVLANRLFSLVTSDGVRAIDRAGDISNGQPKWSGNFTTSFATDRFQLIGDVTYVGGGKYDKTFILPTDVNDNNIPARTFFNLQANIDVGEPGHRRQFFVNVSNLFNTRPPAIFVLQGGPNYDRIGRAVRVGFRFER